MRTISLTIVGLTVGLLASMAATSSNAEETVCSGAGSWTEFRAKVSAAFPSAVAHDVDEAAKSRVVAYYNATPPATTFEPDHVRYFTRPHNEIALIALEKGGCVVATAQIPLKLLKAIVNPTAKGIDI